MSTSAQFCGFSEKCPRGILLEAIEVDDPTIDRVFLIILAVVGSFILSILIGCIIYACRKKLFHRNGNGP